MKKNMSCAGKINVTRSCDASIVGPWHCGLVTAEVSSLRVDYDLHKLEFAMADWCRAQRGTGI